MGTRQLWLSARSMRRLSVRLQRRSSPMYGRPRKFRTMLPGNRRWADGVVRAIEAVVYGAAAGLTGTLVITLLARIVPGMRTGPKKETGGKASKLPDDPFQKQTVVEWQDRSRSPAAYAPFGAGSTPG